MRLTNIKAGIFVMGTLATLLPASVAQAEDVALILANERHKGWARISPASNTALRSLRAAYEEDGFRVVVGNNVTATRLKNMLADFENRAKDADRLVLHYVGHLRGSDDNMRLVPTDMTRHSSLILQAYSTVSLDVIYELLDHRPGKSALILASPTQGAGQHLNNGPHILNGLLVMVGDPRTVNGVVVDELLSGRSSAAEIRERHQAITVAGYVSDEPFSGGPAVAAPSPENNVSAIQEMADWRRATSDGSRAALSDYLARYPNGIFANEATARLEALGPEISREEQAERDLKLTRSQRREIQRQLTLLGFNTRGVDGIFGGGTRRAVTQWQRTERFAESGFLDRQQIRVLERAATVKQEELDRIAEQEKAARDQADLEYWRRTGASGGERDLQDYLARYPDGLFAEQAKRMLQEYADQRGPAVNEGAAATEQALGMNTRARTIVEQRLQRLGYNPGPVDGSFDRDTRQAIAAFQQSKNLNVTGYLDNKTVGQLITTLFQ